MIAHRDYKVYQIQQVLMSNRQLFLSLLMDERSRGD